MKSWIQGSWIGCCALACCLQTRLLLQVELRLDYSDLFVFGALVAGYQLVQREERDWNIVVLGAVLAGFALLHFNFPQLMLCLPPGLFWLLYYGEKLGNLSAARQPEAWGLRNFAWGKPIAVALAWAFLTVILGQYSSKNILLWVFFERFVLIFALALAYDLLDLENDRKLGFKTLASRFGPEKTMTLIGVLLGFSALLVYGITGRSATLSLLLFAFVSQRLIRLMQQTQIPVSRAKMLVDGLMLGQCVWTALITLT